MALSCKNEAARTGARRACSVWVPSAGQAGGRRDPFKGSCQPARRGPLTSDDNSGHTGSSRTSTRSRRAPPQAAPGASPYVRLSLRFVSAYGDAGLGLLGDPSRRAIFEMLARRPCSVQELADRLPISRPAVSQHLKVLRDGDLVVSSSEGTRRIYRLNPEGVTALRSWLDGVWNDALTAFQKVADADTAIPVAEPDPEQERS